MEPNDAEECDGGCANGPFRLDWERRDFLHGVIGCAAAAIAVGCLAAAEASGFGITTAVSEVQGTGRRYPLPQTDGVTVDPSSSVMLVRLPGQVLALAIACPHQRAAVRWLPKEQRFQCSKHDSKYEPNGTYTSGRATRNLDRFPIQREGQSVLIDVTRIYRSDQDAVGWSAAVITL